MSKLNQKQASAAPTFASVAAQRGEPTALSANGNLQFAKAPLIMLYELAVSTLYGKGGQGSSTPEVLVARIDAGVRAVVALGEYDFIANLIMHARVEMNIRTIPIVMVVSFASALRHAGVQYLPLRTLVCDVIRRADQITDLYAHALAVFGDKKHVPTAIKRGVADAFNKFNEYQFGKYNRDGRVTLKDALRIVHPSAKNEEQGAIFAKIMSDTLDTPRTWETVLSANGQLDPAERLTPAAVWTGLLEKNEVPYMALLRNLRNISTGGVSAGVRQLVADRISDPTAVKYSKQLPFDFKQAYDVIRPIDATLARAVSDAMDTSIGNLPHLGDKVWLIVDYSGSMGDDHTEVSAFSNALTLSAAMIKSCMTAKNFALTLFGSSAKTIDTQPMAKQSIMDIRTKLAGYRSGGIAGSTNFQAALAEYASLDFVPDTIIVLTDGEVNYFPYRLMTTINSTDAFKLAINMSGAASTPMSQSDGWYSIAGWSPALFQWVPAMRKGVSVVEQLCVPYVPK